ncbi:MAG: hypothetical protein Sapg2KO_51840 [Saprospiraceae bacterium]
MLEFDLVCNYYKDGMDINTGPMSYPAIDIKFEEGMKNMTQGYKI